MFLDAYGDTVERTDGLLVFLEVGIEGGCTFEGVCGEEFGDAVRLLPILAELLTRGKEAAQLSAQELHVVEMP